MPREYKSANMDVHEIAHELMRETHDHLKDARVELVFLTEAPKSKGREIWGRAKVISGLAAWLATEPSSREKRAQSFFVIEIAESIWNVLDDRKRRALVDHCLSYCQIGESEDELTLKLASPDIAEFSAVVARNGLYFDELEKFVNTANEVKQAGLFDQEGANASARLPRPGKAKRSLASVG